MNKSQPQQFFYLKSVRRIFLAFTIMLGYSLNAHAALITYDFTGIFDSTNSLFASGDTFSGSYTFESTGTPSFPHPDPTFSTETIVIDSAFPGTGWTINVSSSVTTDFSLSGTGGYISVGDNTSFGDRYDITLYNINGLLPNGEPLFLFQIDLYDPISYGADMLSDGMFQSLPNFSLAYHTGGRFLIGNNSGGCDQCFFTATSLTANVSAVPVPATIWLLGSGLLGLIGIRKRNKTYPVCRLIGRLSFATV